MWFKVVTYSEYTHMVYILLKASSQVWSATLGAENHVAS